MQDCTMDEMIEHCAQFVDEVNKGLPQPITKEEYIGQMKMYFPHLKRWRKELKLSDGSRENPALVGVKELIGKMADTLPVSFISSVDEDGYPCTKAMLSPRVREGEPLVGYWVGKPFWNQGICTEALRLMIDHIHHTTDIKSLISSHFIDNPASGRVMEKCGFVPTGETCVDESLAGSDRPMRVLRLEIKR